VSTCRMSRKCLIWRCFERIENSPLMPNRRLHYIVRCKSEPIIFIDFSFILRGLQTFFY